MLPQDKTPGINLSGVETRTDGNVMEVVPSEGPGTPGPVAELLEPATKRSSPSKYRSIELSPAFKADESRDEHPLTAEGKVMHRALETGDDRGLTETQLRLVNMCRSYVEATLPAKAKRLHEVRFPIMDQDYGYGDLVALLGVKGWYIDYKFGFNKQEDAEVNPAAQAYVLGMLTVFPYLNEVEVHYIYPRLEEVSTHTFTRADIPRIIGHIKAIKLRHDKATPETCKYHEDTCIYCTHLGVCPTAGRVLLPVAQRYASTHEMDLPVVPDLSTVTNPETWGRLFRGVGAIEALATSIKRHALEFRQNTGIEIPGTVLKEKKGNRKILSPLAAWEVAKKFDITQEQFLQACDVGVPDLMKAARDNAPARQKGAAEQKLEFALADAGVLTRNDSSWYLARVKGPSETENKNQ